MIAIHGTDDDTVLFDGGLSPVAADALDLPEAGPSIPAIAQLWGDRNGCRGDGPIERDGALTRYQRDCPAGAEVELDVIAGGSHGYPASANERIWAFFERHAITP
jgi:poly(3-hydroxybutyrate) depolymerase